MYSEEEEKLIKRIASAYHLSDSLEVDILIELMENLEILRLKETILLNNSIQNSTFNIVYAKFYFRWMILQSIKSHSFPPKYEALSIDEICSLILGEEQYRLLKYDS